jgi:hypothetical protein
MTDPVCDIYYWDDNGVLRHLDCYTAQLTRQRQTNKLLPRELQLTMSRSSPLKTFDQVLVEKQGRVLFRGYAKFPAIGGKRIKTWTCAGMEDLLLNRRTPTFYFDRFEKPTFGQLFADTLSQDQFPGLIAMANTYIMPGQDYVMQGTENVAILPNMGTDSDLGTSNLYRIKDGKIDQLNEIVDLTEFLARAAANPSVGTTFHRDANKLYINITKGNDCMFWYNLGGVFADAYKGKDTTCRLGHIDNPDEKMSGTLMLNWSVIGDLILNICEANDRYVSIWDDWDYTYFDISESEGREPENGVYKFYESDLIDIKKRAPVSIRAHSITGQGRGTQYYTRDNHSPDDDIKIETIQSFEDEFKDEDGKLVKLTDQAFIDQDKLELWTIAPISPALILMPGDWIRLKPDDEDEKLLKADTIKEDLINGLATIDLSEHKTNFYDVWEHLQEVDKSYTKTYPIEFAEAAGGSDTWDYDYHGIIDGLHVPKGFLQSSLKAKAILSLTLDQHHPSTEDSFNADQLGRCSLTVRLDLNGTRCSFGCFPAIPMGQSGGWTIPEMDVTSLVAENGDNADLHIYISVHPHNVPTNTVQINGSATLTFLKRDG